MFELILLSRWIIGICNNSLIQVSRATRDSVSREYVACNVGIGNKSMAESTDSMQGIFHPTKRTKSEVWAYFGFFKNAEGQLVEDNYPVCRTCKKKVSAKGSNTTNLLTHLCKHHPQLRELLRAAHTTSLQQLTKLLAYTSKIVCCVTQQTRYTVAASYRRSNPQESESR